MRRAEEEWLIKICREFGAKLTIRPLEKPYAFDRGELASALAALLGGLKLVPLAIPGAGNRFLVTLQKGEVENFGSHFQDNPYATGSIGDEKTRWAEFKRSEEHTSELQSLMRNSYAVFFLNKTKN